MHTPSPNRYAKPDTWFRHCGSSGLKLPAVSLGCWHNFGAAAFSSKQCPDEPSQHRNAQKMLFTAFDHGITHFDLANNYGPPPGSAEERVGRILHEDLRDYRDELIISSKAGYGMWQGPYGDGGSRKYLIASCDQSLKRLQLEYVDIFYSHRPDPHTPIAETMGALDQLVRDGKTLYTGLSNYSPDQVEAALKACDEYGFCKPIIHQPRYNLLDRKVERQGLFNTLNAAGMGSICFSPLEGGILTGKYLDADPEDSRKNSGSGGQFFRGLDEDKHRIVSALNTLAENCGHNLTTFALAWTLRHGHCTSALIGASRPSQIEQAAKVCGSGLLTDEICTEAEKIITG
ncbi:aldo/keto reductase [Kiritimatiellaeota bacterium B1221]|nr:aldo/keto reductase [Kiritimatiellaeota bacterium B1221]